MKHAALPYSFIAAMAAFAPIVEREHAAALDVHEDNPRLKAINDLADALAACMLEAPAASLHDLAAKSVILKIRLPAGRPAGTLWNGADLQDQLSWCIAEDAIRLAGGCSATDPAVAAAAAYFEAYDALNATTSHVKTPEWEALGDAVDEAATQAYQTKPATQEGLRALLEVMIEREKGCAPDDKTDVGLATIRSALGSV